MANRAENKISILLNEYTNAMQSYFKAVGVSDSFKIPGPSKEELIEKLELKLGRRLPPSYRAFLMIQDGFPEFDGETNIMSVQDMISFYGDNSDSVLKKLDKEYKDDSLRRCIIFGRSETSISMYLFDPTQVTKDGEWKVLVFDEEDGVDEVYTSFQNFLIESVEQAHDAEKEAKEGANLFDMDF